MGDMDVRDVTEALLICLPLLGEQGAEAVTVGIGGTKGSSASSSSSNSKSSSMGGSTGDWIILLANEAVGMYRVD